MTTCKRHTWKPIAGTERQWPIRNPTGTHIIRYDRYQQFECPKCGCKDYGPAKPVAQSKEKGAE